MVDADVTTRAGVIICKETVDELAGRVFLGLSIETSLETVGAQVVDAHTNVLGEMRHAIVELFHDVAVEPGDFLRCLEARAELADQVLGH